MRTHSILALIAIAGCADQAYDPDAPAIDPNAPRVHITSPVRGTIAGDVTTITVTGTATDDSGEVASVVVNDTPATVAADGTWTAQVKLAPGTNLIHAIAKDKQGNAGKESRAVVAGPMATLARQVPDAVTATLSAQTFDAIGRGAAGFIESDNLMSVVQGMNPVVDVGGGPDCLYGQASITSLTVGDADIVMAPQYGGVFLSGELTNVRVGMHLAYAVSCVDGSRDIVVSAQRVSVQGMLKVGLIGRDFDIKLQNQNVQITGFDVDLGGVPGQIVDMLSLDSAMGPVLGWATERFVVPMLNNALAGLNDTRTIDVLGTQVDIDVEPSQIDFTPEGGKVLLNTTLRAKNDSGSFVYVDNTLPDMDMSHGFQLAVADDAANQLLTSVWSAKGFDKSIALDTGSYGEVGKLYDAVKLEVAVPPYVDATDGKLTLTVGDMVGSFELAGSVVTQVAINAEVELKVVKGSDGALRFDVGTPTVYVDVLDDAIEGGNPLSNAEFEAIASFALSRIVAVGSGAVGAIPLPSVGGVAITTLSVEQQNGYLIVDGEVQ
ncbi:MAG TPA: Ig-like domain-containing protein [Kofleriaceae bacterium]|nr:Ig-like domain-containing protein [Kofleriaceae bacterium]